MTLSMFDPLRVDRKLALTDVIVIRALDPNAIDRKKKSIMLSCVVAREQIKVINKYFVGEPS